MRNFVEHLRRTLDKENIDENKLPQWDFFWISKNYNFMTDLIWIPYLDKFKSLEVIKYLYVKFCGINPLPNKILYFITTLSNAGCCNFRDLGQDKRHLSTRLSRLSGQSRQSWAVLKSQIIQSKF